MLDSIAFDWDGSGRLWVIEMADYPLGMDGKGKPGGRVRILEDVDQDGRYGKEFALCRRPELPYGDTDVARRCARYGCTRTSLSSRYRWRRESGKPRWKDSIKGINNFD